MEPSEPTGEIHELFNLAQNSDILKCSKEQLERYAVALCNTEARRRLRDPEFAQVSETVRTLLIVRMSEEANKEATRISTIALLIAGAALVLTLAQAAFSLFSLLAKA
jgi:hypothetical protein